MIITASEFKTYVETSKQEPFIEAKLKGIEQLIRSYTNNNFQVRNIRTNCPILSQKVYTTYGYFKQGDTVQISDSIYNDGLYVVKEILNGFISLDQPLLDEPNVLITKVDYPMDVRMGVINLLQWDLENRDKVGIASESISRHSVTYFNMDGDNSNMGYPKSLIGFLKPYVKARF